MTMVSRSPVWGWVRGGLYIERGIELWNDNDNINRGTPYSFRPMHRLATRG